MKRAEKSSSGAGHNPDALGSETAAPSSGERPAGIPASALVSLTRAIARAMAKAQWREAKRHTCTHEEEPTDDRRE